MAPAILFCLALPELAGAQTALPQNDAIIAIGWAGSEYKFHTRRNWHSSLFVGVSGGHYWSDHLKTEVAIAWQNVGSGQSYAEVVLPGSRTYAVWDHRTQQIRVGVTQIYQFGRNAWVHPFIGAGVDVVREDVESTRVSQWRTDASSRTVSIVAPREILHEDSHIVQPHVRTGLKAYFSDKAFWTSELKLGFTSGLAYALWNTGIGFDF
jgi:hypothetical protein